MALNKTKITDSKLVKIKQVRYKKLYALGKDISIGTHNPDNVISN